MSDVLGNGPSMVEVQAFLNKVRSDIRGGRRAYVYFDGLALTSRRESSVSALKVRQDQLIGVYDAAATDADIIEDCLWHIETYRSQQAAQCRRLTAALGVA